MIRKSKLGMAFIDYTSSEAIVTLEEELVERGIAKGHRVFRGAGQVQLSDIYEVMQTICTFDSMRQIPLAVDDSSRDTARIVRPCRYTDSFATFEVGETTSHNGRQTSSMEWTEIDTRIESGSSYHYRLATTVLVRAQGRRLSSVGAAERSGSILPLGCRIYDVVASGSTFHSRIVHFFERLNLFCPLFHHSCFDVFVLTT